MTHREAKRPYGGSQPHITSYFPQQSPLDTEPQSQSYSITQAPEIDSKEGASPSIPHNIQSNLLNVGMRVRKSVPEGYKTGSEYSAFSLFQHGSKSVPSTPTTVIMASSPPNKTRPRANAGAGTRELMPFCGLLKVGGLGAQQGWGIYSPTHETRNWVKYDCHNVEVESMTPEEEEVPFLSQGSTVSGNGSGRASPARNKRRCEWDDSGDDESVEEDVAFRMPVALGERLIAMPRRKKGLQKSVDEEGRESKVFGAEMDFGEAEFLDYSGFGRGREVEMGGV